MLNYTQRCNCNLSDAYTLMYGFIGKKLIEELGMEGEAALREGSRQYGYDAARRRGTSILRSVQRSICKASFPSSMICPRTRASVVSFSS